MVVYRVIGDRWKYADRLAISVKPQEAFQIRTSDLLKELELETLAGWAVYRTEGRHPGFIHPTLPIDMKSNPQKEKMTADGSVLYVKEADLDRQQQDRIFHEGLLEFRKEKGYKGLQKEGVDVAEFKEALFSRLNVDDTKDVTEMEDKARGKIAGEEHRSFWAVTFEYREMQALKDKETEGRDEVRLEFTTGLAVAHITMVLMPGLELSEAAARKDAINIPFMEGVESLLERERADRPVPPKTPTPSPSPARSETPPTPPTPPPVPQQVVMVQGGGGGMSKEDMEGLVGTLKGVLADSSSQSQLLVQELQQQFNATVKALSNDLRKSATEIQELRSIVQGRNTTTQEVLLETETKIIAKLEKQRQQLVEEKAKHATQRNSEISKLLEGPRNDEVVATMRKLVVDQNNMLQSLIREEDAMIKQEQQSLRTLEDGHRAGFLGAAMSNIGVDTAIDHMKIAQQEIHAKLVQVERLLKVNEVAREEQKQLRIRQEEEAAQMMRYDMEQARLAEIDALTTRVTLPAISATTANDVVEDMMGGGEDSPSSPVHPVVAAAKGVLAPRLEAALLIFLHHHCDHNALLAAIGGSIERMFGAEIGEDQFSSIFNEAAAVASYEDEVVYADAGLEDHHRPSAAADAIHRLFQAIDGDAELEAGLEDDGPTTTAPTDVPPPPPIAEAIDTTNDYTESTTSPKGGMDSEPTADETGGATDDGGVASSSPPPSVPSTPRRGDVAVSSTTIKEDDGIIKSSPSKKKRSGKSKGAAAAAAAPVPPSVVPVPTPTPVPTTASVEVSQPTTTTAPPSPSVAVAAIDEEERTRRRAQLYQQRVKRAAAQHLLHLLVLECGGDPYAVVDALVWTFQINSHPYSDHFVNVLEQYNEVSLVPAVDLLLDVFYGREVELMLALCPRLIEEAAGAPLEIQWLFESYRCVLLAAQNKAPTTTFSNMPSPSQAAASLSYSSPLEAGIHTLGGTTYSHVTDNFLAVIGDERNTVLTKEEWFLTITTTTTTTKDGEDAPSKLLLDGAHFYHPAVAGLSQWNAPFGW